MLCSKCGKEIPDGSKFCVHCGNKVEIEVKETAAAESIEPNKAEAVKLCTGCGAVLKPGTKFCTKCGAKVVDTVAEPSSQSIQKQKPPKEAVNPKKAEKVKKAPEQKPLKKKKKSSKKWIAVFLIVLFLLLAGIGAGAVVYNMGESGKGPVDAFKEILGMEGDSASDTAKAGNGTGGTSENGENTEKGDVSLLDSAIETGNQAKSEYQESNYIDGAIPHCNEALTELMTVGIENNLVEESQDYVTDIYSTYVDAIIAYSDEMRNQGANAAVFEQIGNIIAKASELTASLTENGYTVDSDSLYQYKEDTIQTFRDMFISSINDITEYENWSRDEAWTYAEQAYSIKENGKPILFDDEDLEDPLRMRYVYCLAWITTKRCETGIEEGTLSYADAVNSLTAILDETDYNLLLLQYIISYGSNAGIDISKYLNAYNAIVDEIKREQNLTIGTDIGVTSATSVDLRHFWYFNDLDGEESYKVDAHNGTTKATRDWIRSNIPGMLNE